MWKLLFKYKWYAGLILLMMVLEPTINSILNFWLQSVFNSASSGADRIYVLRLLTGGFLLWVCKRLVTYVMLVLRDRYICNLKQDVKHSMFMRLIGVNTANISDSGSSGEYISMFTNDIILLEQRFFNQIMGLISSVFSIAILGYSFVVLNPTLAWSIIGFGVATMFVPLIFSQNLNAKNMVYAKKIAAFTQKLKEYIVAYPTIKNYSIEPAIEDAFRQHNRDTEDAKFEADCAISLANSISQLLAWFMQFIGVGLGLMMVVKGEILVGTVIAAQSFASDLALPLQNMLIGINSIRSVKNIVTKLESLADRYEPEAPAGEPVPAHSPLDICFRNLTLKLGEKTVIDDFSFCFEKGKKYLVVGVNGSGKSSVFKVLKKWYSYSQGEITLGGRSITDMTNEELSGIVSYMNENVPMFSGSVRDNITLFRDCDEKRFQDALERSHVELDPERNIADEGRNISSGEQRRIEIARSLLCSASVLIFDEVVSTLDIETAYEIENAVLGFAEKTVIFISHNFSGKLIRSYDEILVMQEGKLLSHGTYEQLMKTCPYFQRICQIKFG